MKITGTNKITKTNKSSGYNIWKDYLKTESRSWSSPYKPKGKRH